MARYPKMWPVGGHPEGEAKVRQLQALDLPWARASGPGWVAEKQGDFANVKYGEKNRLYLDFGWWIDNEIGSGWPTEAGTGRYDIAHSNRSTATISQLSTWLKTNAGVALNKIFVDTVKKNGAKAGKSFGKGITYSGEAVDVAAKKEADAELLKMKTLALPAIGASTGLQRCRIKGLIGRPLRKTPQITFTWESVASTIVAGETEDPHTTGILIRQKGFSVVKVSGGTATITDMAIPNTCKPLWVAFRELLNQGASHTLCACAATHLLAYAEKSKDPYVISISGDPVSTAVLFGWRFSLFSNECVSTEMVDEGSLGARMTVQQITFTEVEVSVGSEVEYRFTATAENVDVDYLETASTPAVWMPAPADAELHKLTSLGETPSPTATPAINAYFDHEDELVIHCVGLPESATSPSANELVEEVADYACAVGVSTYYRRYESATKTKKLVTITKPVVNATTQYPSSYSEDVDTFSVESMTLRMDSSAGGPAGGQEICSRVDFVEDTFSPVNRRYRSYHGDHNRHDIDKIGSDTSNLAAIIPYTYVDSCIYISTKSDYWQESTFTRVITNSIRGVRMYPSSLYPFEPIADLFYPVSRSAGFGAGIDSTITDTSTPSEQKWEKTASAPVVTGSGMAVEVAASQRTTTSADNPDLFTFITNGNFLLYFMPFTLHSLHGESWGMIHPSIGKTVINGESWILDRLPIGFE